MDMNIKTILLLFLLLIPFAGCDDDDFPFSGKWTNERNDTLEFDEGSMIYESDYIDEHQIRYANYFLLGDSIYLLPTPYSSTYLIYPIDYSDNEIVLYDFQGMDKTVFVK